MAAPPPRQSRRRTSLPVALSQFLALLQQATRSRQVRQMPFAHARTQPGQPCRWLLLLPRSSDHEPSARMAAHTRKMSRLTVANCTTAPAPLTPVDLPRRLDLDKHRVAVPRPSAANDPPPHHLQVCTERTFHRCHRLGESLPVLPAAQRTLPCPGTAATHTGPHTPFQSHPRGSGGPLSSFKSIHPPVHCHGQDFLLV
jgi:hypothetical protein